MAILNIITEGDETLRKVSRPVTEVTPRIRQLLDDMTETLAEANGVGLAAPQVGILRRVVIVDDGERYLELINPEILETEGEHEVLEGCLSVPNVWGKMRRPERVRLRAMNREGEMFEIEGEGLTAQAFCHEIAHLDGKLFIDDAIELLSPEEVKALREKEDGETDDE